MSWNVAYKHDRNGNKTGGDIDDLISAVRRGASVKIMVQIVAGDGTPKYEMSVRPTLVWIDRQRAFASALQYHTNFDPNGPTWYVHKSPVRVVWGTDGKERVNGSNPSFAWAMEWCVDL